MVGEALAHAAVSLGWTRRPLETETPGAERTRTTTIHSIVISLGSRALRSLWRKLCIRSSGAEAGVALRAHSVNSRIALLSVAEGKTTYPDLPLCDTDHRTVLEG